jgi:hypothetical protein
MSKQTLQTLSERIEKLEQTTTEQEQRSRDKARALEATSNPWDWCTKHTKTYNEHWVEEGRPSPYEPFPPYEYFRDLWDIFDLERITFIEKSRDMMASWTCVAYFTLHAMREAERGVIFQTQKLEKAIDLVNYAKCLYRNQADYLKDAFPLAKPLESQPRDCLEFASGGYVLGIPGGADQLRGHHPWGYFNDETSFQPEAGECYNEALSAVKGKIILCSTAGPGWYADVRRDIIRNVED